MTDVMKKTRDCEVVVVREVTKVEAMIMTSGEGS